jgi:hypothetical protein
MAALDAGVCSASDINDYEKQKIMFLENRAWLVLRP